MTPRLQQVLFVCSRNAGRSQIAAAFFNVLADPEKARAISAGLDPAPRVHPEVVTAMQEVGIDLSAVQPIELTARMQTEVSFLVTLGCAERCPLISAGRRADWKIDDPETLPLARVREIRDQIRGLVAGLVVERAWG
jgi:arsenate reductase (thioredoxin)